MKNTIGLIGVGNMGTAILEGLFHNGVSKPSGVWVYDKMTNKSKEFSKKWGSRACLSSEEVARHARWILLAVKPQDLTSIGSELKPSLSRRHGLISILAGTPIAKIRRVVGREVSLIRAMPNLGAQVGESMTALTGTSKSAMAAAKTIFNACGKTMILPERQFDLVTAMSGSGPAYFFFLMEALMQFGIRHGLKAEDARQLAVQTAEGASRIALSSALEPSEWRERVTSKKGTTEAALKVIKKAKVENTLSKAFQAALVRGRELSRF